MANALKPDELGSYRDSLLDLRARLRGDLDQMTDEALRRGQPDSSGNLSNVPLHMADVGTENYDQEFTLSLIENDQDTLGQIHEALTRIDAGTYGRCEECNEMIAKPRLQALPYTKHCITCASDGEPRMNQASADQRSKRPISPGRAFLFWAIALAGAGSTWRRRRTSSASSASLTSASP